MSNYNDGTVSRHAKVKLAKYTGHAQHPLRNKKNHDDLLEYLRERLALGKSHRDSTLDRLVSVDKSVAGWLKHDEEDRKRLKSKDETGVPIAVKMNLPVSFIHIDDMMTYFAETFAPSRGMFYHTGDPAEVTEATQIITKMNNDAIYAGFYAQVLKGIYASLKYNTGGFVNEWSQDRGPKLDSGPDGELVIDEEVKWQGNRLEAIDNYNFLPDPSVPLPRLHKDGEFAATVTLRSHYWVKSRAAAGALFNCESLLTKPTSQSACKYYRSPPQETEITSDTSRGTRAVDWVSILSDVPYLSQTDGYEEVTMWIRLNPTEWGLVPAGETAAARDRYELWRFKIMNDEFIVSAEWLNNAHGHIPCYLGHVNDDFIGSAQKSVAEILQPLQDFASFLMNLHVENSRSALYGTTFYDPTVVDYSKIPKGEVAARVPMEARGYGKDIRKAVYDVRSNIDTNQTISDLGGLMDMINQFFPTQALPSQIANIDRAVQSQVAAVQHGANRRQQKTARLLDDSIFSKIRYSMYYNILQYMPSDVEEITDYYTGKPVKIDLGKMRNTNLPFIIGQGLKAIDRQAVASMMQNIIFALIQAPQAAQGIDLLGLIDYWTSMIDVDIDMKQFRVQPPEADGEAPAEGQDAEGSPINPATSPAKLTDPIYS